jgi:predicted PurR-regulated permease PerM
MDFQIALLIIFVIIMLSVMVLAYIVVSKVTTQTDTLIKILNSFNSIDTNLKLLVGKVDNFENTSRTLGNRNIDIVTSSVSNMSDRLERMDNKVDSRLENVERRVTNLHQHCSGKLSQ